MHKSYGVTCRLLFYFIDLFLPGNTIMMIQIFQSFSIIHMVNFALSGHEKIMIDFTSVENKRETGMHIMFVLIKNV